MYKNIKNILKRQVEAKLNTFWIYIEEEEEFVQIYKIICNKYKVYTPQQLLDKLNTKEAIGNADIA
jgi:hypothetical protein